VATQARVVVVESVSKKFENGWALHFQWCIYKYSNATEQRGYRFIWTRPDGTLQAARGQARLPNMELIVYLTEEAKKRGWGYIGSETPDPNS